MESLGDGMRRADFLRRVGTVTAAMTVPGLLAAYGSDEAKAVARTPIVDEPGNLRVFEWPGYDVRQLCEPYLHAGFSNPKYTLIVNDDQSLSKVRAGFRPDVAGPTNNIVQDFVHLGVLQPWDTSLIKNFKSMSPILVKEGKVNGKQYAIPHTWSFESVLYRTDKVEPKRQSWDLLFDERYKGKISWYDDSINIVIAGYVQGVSDPWDMPDDELSEIRDFLISKKALVRNFWTSQAAFEKDFASGHLWIAYAWPASFAAMKSKGRKVKYMDPKEGRLSWVDTLVLLKNTKNYYHAHRYADSRIAPRSAKWMIENYYYASSNTSISLDNIDPALVKSLQLDDPSAIKEPSAHIRRHLRHGGKYSRAWEEVKAA